MAANDPQCNHCYSRRDFIASGLAALVPLTRPETTANLPQPALILRVNGASTAPPTSITPNCR